MSGGLHSQFERLVEMALALWKYVQVREYMEQCEVQEVISYQQRP